MSFDITIVFHGLRDTSRDIIPADRGTCGACKKRKATVFLQSKDGENEYMLCKPCFENLKKEFPDVEQYYYLYPMGGVT